MVYEINERVQYRGPRIERTIIDTVRWYYQDGKVIRRQEGNNINNYEAYTYNASGKLFELNACFNVPCSLVDRLSYNAENRLATIEQYFGSGSGILFNTMSFDYLSQDTFILSFTNDSILFRFTYDTQGNIQSIEDSVESSLNYKKTVYEYDNGKNPFQSIADGSLDPFWVEHFNPNNWVRKYLTRDSLLSLDSLTILLDERIIEYNAYNYPLKIEEISGGVGTVKRFEYICE